MSIFTKKHTKNYKADIIVIGGGAAGCVLMNRLSKDFSVIGIEAGGNLTTDPAIEAVGLPAFLLPGTAPEKYFWPGWKQTVSMPGLNGRVSDWTTGMILGGGSSINGLYYGRGTNTIYQQWEGISGSSNWSLDNILNSFNKLENYQGLSITPNARGINGNVNVLQTPTISPLTLNVLLPSLQAAFPSIPLANDYNDPTVQNCIDLRAQWFIDPTGTQRVSSATAFLGNDVMTSKGVGVNDHKKLRVLFNSVVVKIIFDKHRRAKAVLLLRKGKLIKVRAKKLVVLASGINSSKLLQLSGIGPSSVLANAGISPVFINENVGQHLQNHPTIFISLLANPDDIGVPSDAEYAFTIANVYLPVVGGNATDPRMLQILFEFIPANVSTGTPALVVIGFDLLNPVSEGSVNIQSNNAFQIAEADDGFYQNPTDLTNMKNAVQVYIQDLLNQLALVGTAPFYRPIITDPINLVILSNYSDDSVEAYVKNNTNLSLDIHHFTSHCKMAPLEQGGVVNGNTRVHGTQNVYVADNAICPVIPDINTTAPAMMIGYRTSEILKHFLFKHKK